MTPPRSGRPFTDFTAEVQRECHRMSRTSRSGSVDVAAAPEKADIVPAGLDERQVPETARANVAAAVGFLAGFSGDARVSLVETNRRVTSALTRNPGEFRRFDADRHRYAPAATVPRLFDEFADVVNGYLAADRLDDREVHRMLAATHWSVNLHGHFFADGCGRTAVVYGAWLYWHGRGTVPRLPERAEYLRMGAGRSWDEFAGDFCPGGPE